MSIFGIIKAQGGRGNHVMGTRQARKSSDIKGTKLALKASVNLKMKIALFL